MHGVLAEHDVGRVVDTSSGASSSEASSVRASELASFLEASGRVAASR